jgi:ABC-2 type transport system permease protein
MFAKVAGFEFGYQIRQPVFWITLFAFLFFPFLLTTVDVIQFGAPGSVHKNSPVTIGYLCLAMSLFFMFASTAFVANVVIRDEETGFGPIIRSTGISRFDYLAGRFTGAFGAVALAFVAVPVAIFLGSLMPWVDHDKFGPNHFVYYAQAYLVTLPTLFATAVFFFALATAVRSMMATYLGLIAFLIIYTVATTVAGLRAELQPTVALLEPFGTEAFARTIRYWTSAESNTQFPVLAGTLLWNRLIWVFLSVSALVATIALFRFEVRGVGAKRAVASDTATSPGISAGLPKPRFDRAAVLAQLFGWMRFEMAQMFKSPAFPILLVLGVLNAVGVLFMMGELFGTAIYPVTRKVISALEASFTLVPPIIATYYAGELVWRERDRKTHEIVDATAVPDWIFLTSKVLAIIAVLTATMLVGGLTGIVMQLAKGYTNLEIGKYLAWYILPETGRWILIAVLAVFFQALSPHKFIGWGLMLLYLVSTMVLGPLGFENKLYTYASGLRFPLSDMNGAGRFGANALWFYAYWGAFALVLLVVSYGLWRRGTETRLKPRLRRAPARMRGLAGVLGGVGLVVFVSLAVFITINTKVWNTYRTSIGDDKWAAAYEKMFLANEKIPQPTVTHVRLNVDLHPHAPSVAVDGDYVLENRTTAPIPGVHLRWDRDLKLTSVTLPGATLQKAWPDYHYRIYRFAKPLLPGEKITLGFKSVRAQRGVRNSGNESRVVDNGAFVNNFEIAPMIGMARESLIQDRVKRRRYHLAQDAIRPVKLSDDPALRGRNYIGADWVTADITVTTDADQTPVSPGAQVSDVTKDGRRTVRFVTEAPVLNFFSVQSARYLIKHEVYKGIDLRVYYDPHTPQNADRMLAALRHSLDYFQAEFSPYQFRQARIVEFPDYALFAQSFPNTFAWSEGLGFIADNRDKDKIDYVTYVAAHEFGHQWWAHQVVGADMQGQTVLSETLAQYSAIMVMEHLYGPDQIRKFLKHELDQYLKSRGGEAVEEVPLARVENQGYIHYNKGSLVMYLLKDQIGEAAVNRALRRVIAQYAFKGAPYANSNDLIRALRAEAPADKQQLITDLFEKITLYDLKVTEFAVTPRADKKFDVKITVDAKKVYADGKGVETPANLNGERFDIGLFTAEPGKKGFGPGSVLLFETQPLKGGLQSFKFVTDKRPTFAGVDPYNKRIDRNSDDNVKSLQ